MTDSSPRNQGHLQWGVGVGAEEVEGGGGVHGFLRTHAPPPLSSRCLFDQVLSGRFDQQLMARDWPRCAPDAPLCDEAEDGRRGGAWTEGCGEPPLPPPSRRARA